MDTHEKIRVLQADLAHLTREKEQLLADKKAIDDLIDKDLAQEHHYSAWDKIKVRLNKLEELIPDKLLDIENLERSLQTEMF